MSQDYNDILETNTLEESRQIILDRDNTIATDFAGTTFPSNPSIGWSCYRTDENKIYKCTQITPSVIWVDISTLIDTVGVGGGAGVFGYLDNTTSVDGYKTFTIAPVIGTETVLNGVANYGVTLISGFVYTYPQNRDKWEGGIWRFITWASVDSAVGISEIISCMYAVENKGGTATFSGTGTSRTCIIGDDYTGTPFVAGDVNADPTLSGYVQTASGTFQITGYTSLNTVTVSTPVGYVNESYVDYTVHKYKFQGTTGEINNTGSTTASSVRYVTTVAQPDIPLSSPTDTIACRYYAKTDSGVNKTLYMTINGTIHNSYIETPLATPHDRLAGKDLLNTDYHHLTTASWMALTGGGYTTLHKHAGSGVSFAVAGGTADAMTADFDPDLTLTDGCLIEIRAIGANTIIEPTISVDGGTARKIYKQGNQALSAGDIPAADAIILLQYKLATTRWELLNPAASSGNSFTTYKYVATAGQTTFTGADANSLTLAYSINNILVFVNGVLLDKTDYTASNGTSVVLGVACIADDEVVIQALTVFEVADAYTKAESDTALTTFVATTHSWTKAQSGTQYALTSTSNHIATDCDNGNNFSHTMSEDTTLDNPSHIVAGTDYKWTFTQHASSAKTLALGNYFKTADGKAFVGLPTTVGSICTLIAYAETSTRLVCALNKEGQT